MRDSGAMAVIAGSFVALAAGSLRIVQITDLHIGPTTIAAGLRGAGYHVDLFNLRSGCPPDPKDYQLFGVGSPVYYYHVPVNVARYVEQLPSLEGIDGFVFIAHGTRRVDTANWLRRTLARKGVREAGRGKGLCPISV